MLKAGYLEDWQYHDTLSGAPQGGVVSPDPQQHLPGQARQVRREGTHPAIHPRGNQPEPGIQRPVTASRLRNARQHGDRDKPGTWPSSARRSPRVDPMDPGYRRLYYCRYADDHLLGFTGPKAEAEQIKGQAGARSCGRPSPGTEPAEQDPDHPRPHPRGAVPRL